MRPALRTISVVFLFIFIFLAPCASWPEENRLGEVEKDVNALKKENEELRKRLDNVEADAEEIRHSYGTLSKLVDVSGYADADFSLTDQKDENARFRIRHLSLFFTKDIQKEWKLFTEIEFEDAPRIESDPATDTVSRSQGTVFVEQMYIEYHPALEWNLSFGRFLTPAGIWAIYHYPPYVPTQTGPLFNKVIFPEVSDGVQLRNSFSIRDYNVDTHLYAANGSGNPGGSDRNGSKGIGARVNSELLDGLSAGASYYREKDNQDIKKASYGVHLMYNYSALKFQAEYAIRHNEPPNGASFNDIGYYAQLAYDIGRWTLAGRFDWYDKSDRAPSNGQSRYTGALNYHFAHNVVGKLEFNRSDFNDPAVKDSNTGILAIAVAIGDL